MHNMPHILFCHAKDKNVTFILVKWFLIKAIVMLKDCLKHEFIMFVLINVFWILRCGKGERMNTQTRMHTSMMIEIVNITRKHRYVTKHNSALKKKVRWKWRKLFLNQNKGCKFTDKFQRNVLILVSKTMFKKLELQKSRRTW